MTVDHERQRDLEYLKQFLENECNWHRVGGIWGSRHRELVAVASRPVAKLASFRSPEASRDCVVCHLVILHRQEEHVVCVSLDRNYIGSFKCQKIQRMKRCVEGLECYYRLQFHSSFIPVSLGISPQLSPYKTTSFYSAEILYKNCKVVTEIPNVHPDDIVCLGSVGAWCVRDQNRVVNIFCYVICFDLFAGCFHGIGTPSLGKLVSDSVRCQEANCVFCVGHGKHVDPVGSDSTCIMDNGNCFCYATCQKGVMKITNDEHLPFLTLDDEKAATMTLMYKFPIDQSKDFSVGDQIVIRDNNGIPLRTRSEAWQLVKIQTHLSELLLTACPILKRVVSTRLLSKK